VTDLIHPSQTVSPPSLPISLPPSLPPSPSPNRNDFDEQEEAASSGDVIDVTDVLDIKAEEVVG